MDVWRPFLFAFAITTIVVGVSSRAVNISNTWVLPEEGFPVFYRYFRDRISWYEADAVCQFHHANLVTVDTTSQYDAIRAYLKELDITNNVWIGLSKTSEKPNFTWTDFRPLSSEGYWQEAIPVGNDPVCAAMDPAADFWWKALPCGGPSIASFICELPVPSWAMGPGGCLLTELPSLTVLFVPEQSALELTSDCGLDGTKRIVCKGNVDREEIMRQLTCGILNEDFDEKSTKPPQAGQQETSTTENTVSNENSLNVKTTKPWIWTSNTIDVDYGMPTRHRRETEDTLSPVSTKSTTVLTAKMTTSTTPVAATTRTESAIENIVSGDVSVDPNKSVELTATQVSDLTTEESSNEPEPERQAETFGTATATTEFRIGEDAGEYPSAINQGQLFSIIENGTMFDIIELNETLGENTKQTAQKESTEKVKLATTMHELYTTVSYHKEPPEESISVTNKSPKKPEKANKANSIIFSDKISHKKKTVNDIEDVKSDKTLSKEVEMFPIVDNTLVKLNRTHRKELPLVEDSDLNNNKNSMDEGEINNAIEEHKHVEIKLDKKGDNNITFFVTTKIKKTKKAKAAEIDSKLNILNNSNNTAENNDSETFAVKPQNSPVKLAKEKFLPKSLLTKTHEDETAITITEEPIQPEPQALPKPNRQRQLTRPQRRSFYPYFFSRVLG